MNNKFANLTDEERLKKLETMPDEEIDYSEIPATTYEDWKGARRVSPRELREKLDKLKAQADKGEFSKATPEEVVQSAKKRCRLKDET